MDVEHSSESRFGRATRSVALPRQIAMYLAKKLTGSSLPAIGKSFAAHGDMAAEVRRLAEAGVDGLFCDFPGACVAARQGMGPRQARP